MNQSSSRRFAAKALLAPLFASPLFAGWSKKARAAGVAAPAQAFGIPLGGIFCMKHSPKGSTLATGGNDGVVRLWDDKGHLQRVFEGHTARVASLAFSPDGKSLASASFDGTTRVWNVQTGAVKLVLHGHGDRVYCVDYSPNGRLVASGGFDGLAKVYDARSGHTYATLTHDNRVSGVAFSADGQTLTTCCFDGLVRSWKVPKLTGPMR